MKVAILSHFQSFAPSYALAVGWYERAKMLEYFGVDFTFFTAKNCPEGSYPRQRAVLKTIPGSKPFDFKVKEFTRQYVELLQGYDVVLTPDLIYQRKGNFLAWNQSMRNASRHLHAWWCHWIHSSWTKRPNNINTKDPDSLRYTMMDRSFLVYLNSYELPQVAEMYDTSPKNLRYVYNPKDPRVFFDMHDFSWKIIAKLKLYEKDVICIFPHCSTRMDAKGIDTVINVVAACKRAGAKVGLVFCNANARKVQKEIDDKKKYMAGKGLTEWEDYAFTHGLDPWKPMPRKVVRDLMRISNLFVFGSWRETTGNVFQEAQISGCTLVLNKNLPCLRELATKIPSKVAWLTSTYKTPGVKDGLTGDLQQVTYKPSEDAYYDEFVKHEVLSRVENRHYQWDFSFEKIWYNQLKPLLDEAAYLANTVPSAISREPNVAMELENPPVLPIWPKYEGEADQC